MKKNEFIGKVSSLSLSMLIIQSTSMGFSVYLSSRLEAEEMGIFHMIMSVYAFAVTVATSAIPLSATRLVSEEPSTPSRKYILKRCIYLSLVFSSIAMICLVSLSGKISFLMFKNASVSLHLKLLGVSLPFFAVSGAIRGYFTGVQKVALITASIMAEEFSSLFSVLFLLKLSLFKNSGALIPVIAELVSSVFSFLCTFGMYVFSTSKYTAVQKKNSTASILSISAPVAVGSYIRSSLGAAENLIIPSALSSFSGNGIKQYGTVKGMAMPVIMFPYVFLQSFTSLLVPEISSRNTKSKKSVSSASLKSIKSTLLFSSAVFLVLLVFGREIGFYLYGNFESGLYITALSLLAPLMYVDTVTDSLLKGLNEQVYSLKINIADSLLRLPMIYFLLPKTGVWGYIAVLYISETLNLALSMARLKKTLA